MFTISKEIEFDAGHRVPLHESKCHNPHGHRYKVVAHVIADQLINSGAESGMVRDFGIVKQLLTEKVHDKLDHGFIVAKDDLTLRMALGVLNEDGSGINYAAGDTTRYQWKIIEVPFWPTAENLAKYIYDILKPDLPGLEQIDVWETPTSLASYFEDGFETTAEKF